MSTACERTDLTACHPIGKMAGMSNKQKVSVDVLGCLPFLIGFLVLSSLGFCGKGCQDKVVDGIKTVREATR